MKGFTAVFLKELSHIRCERSTLFFALLIPAMQLTIFGYAANTTIDNVPVVVLNLDRRMDSRHMLEAFTNSGSFKIVRSVANYDEMRSEIRSGRAKAAFVIPPDFADSMLKGHEASVQMLIDGSDAQVAAAALNNASLITQSMAFSLAKKTGERGSVAPSRDQYGHASLPVELRPRVLYNPDLLDANFFVPGLIAIILQFILSFLTAFSIARERESGTLEQMFVTPVSPSGLLFGKLIPYAGLAFVELVIVILVMNFLFKVPVTGSVIQLFGVCVLFILTALGLGLMVSTFAETQLQALQATFLIMLPSVLLSGFVFPRSEMPLILYALGAVLPATYFVDLLRGIIIRGAGILDLVPSLVGLAICFAAIISISLFRSKKTID